MDGEKLATVKGKFSLVNNHILFVIQRMSCWLETGRRGRPRLMRKPDEFILARLRSMSLADDEGHC